MKITESTLTQFFAKDGQFRTNSGILIKMTDNVFSLEVKLKNDEQEGTFMICMTKYIVPKNFIAGEVIQFISENSEQIQFINHS